MISNWEEGLKLKKVSAILLGAVAAVAVLTGPSWAKTSDPPKSDNKPSSPACSVYQRMPDGSWGQAPCEEINSGAPANPKTSAKGTGDAAH